MIENIRSLCVGIAIAVIAFLKPIEGELTSLMIVFFLNFLFGYLSGMIANHEDFSLKKALRCGAEATVFFILCCAIYTVGQMKHQYEGALQCVSFVTYVVLYFYALNILKNLKKIFKPGTTPWQIVSFDSNSSNAYQDWQNTSILQNDKPTKHNTSCYYHSTLLSRSSLAR